MRGNKPDKQKVSTLSRRFGSRSSGEKTLEESDRRHLSTYLGQVRTCVHSVLKLATPKRSSLRLFLVLSLLTLRVSRQLFLSGRQLRRSHRDSQIKERMFLTTERRAP